MNISELPASFYVIGEYSDSQKQVSPLFFDLPTGGIAIPVWSNKTRAYSWLEGTFIRADYQIVELFRDEFVPNLYGSKCECLIFNPEASEKTFAPERVVEIPAPKGDGPA